MSVSIADYEAAFADYRRLVRELDVALNGDGAAKQASLCDVVSQVKDERWKLVKKDDLFSLNDLHRARQDLCEKYYGTKRAGGMKYECFEIISMLLDRTISQHPDKGVDTSA